MTNELERWVACLEAGDTAAVIAAIDGDPSLVVATTDDADTLLHLACWQKQHAIVTALLERDAAVDARGCYGRTPLHYAVHEGDRRSTAIVDALMAKGADPSARDDAGFSVEDWAKVEIDCGLAPVLALLRGTPWPGPRGLGRMTAAELAILIERGDVEGVSAALTRDASLASTPLPDGDNALHRACLHKQVAIFGTLLAHGPDLDASGHRGQRPLHAAVRDGGAISICIVSTLLACGADPNLPDDDGVSVAELAARELEIGRDQVLGLLRGAPSRRA